MFFSKHDKDNKSFGKIFELPEGITLI